jgi:hypothetical protein
MTDNFGNKVIAIILTFVAVLIVISIIVLTLPAWAHDHDHPELNAWYETLKNANDVPCCDSSEATRVENVDWQSKCADGRCTYQVFIAKKWWDVPEWAVLTVPNRNGTALVWPIYYWNDGKPENGISSIFIRCFMPGAGG